MAKKAKPIDDDPHHSFEDTSFGIGQNADGTLNTFPAAELAARTEARDRDEAATRHALEQSEKGFPAEEDSNDRTA